jgi:hypothetical protein
MSVDNAAKFDLSQDRVVLIWDLFTMVQSYLKTEMKKNLQFYFLMYFNILLLNLPLTEMSIRNISWGVKAACA